MTLEVTEKRIAQLEGALATSKDQVSTLRGLVLGLVSNDRDQVAKILRQGVLSGATDAAEAGFLPDKALPFEAPEHRTAVVAPAGLASSAAERVAAGSRTDAAAAEGGGAAPSLAEGVTAAANKGSTTQAGSGQDRANLAALSPGAGSPGGVDRPHAGPIGSSLQPAQDALGAACVCTIYLLVINTN